MSDQKICLSIENEEATVFGLSGGSELIGKVCQHLNVAPGKILIKRFADGEIFVKSLESVRNKDIFVIQSVGNPVNDNLMELLIAIDSLKRASARSITAIIPYFGYARQDRKASGREPITARLVADLLTTAGSNRISLIDIHSEQEQGFFNIPVDTMNASIILFDKFFAKHDSPDMVIVAPDYGGVKRARLLAQQANRSVAIVDKRRIGHNQCESISLLGEVENKVCVITDDMIDTAGTIIEAAKLLKQRRAREVYVVATHGLFNRDAITNLQACFDQNIINGIWVSNSLIQKNAIKQNPKIKIVCLSELLASLIHAYVKKLSLSHIYDHYTKFRISD